MLFGPTPVTQITRPSRARCRRTSTNSQSYSRKFAQFCARCRQSLQARPFHEPQQPTDLHEYALARHVPSDFPCAVDKRKYLHKTNSAAHKRKRSTGRLRDSTTQAEDQTSGKNGKDSPRRSSDRCEQREPHTTDNAAATSGPDTRQLNSTNWSIYSG